MQVNMEGVVVGIVALVMIGVFHPIVIKCEYYFSHRIYLPIQTKHVSLVVQ